MCRRFEFSVCRILVAGLLFFNFYYFFIRANIGPAYYLNKLFYPPKDDILEKSVYQDMSEEYSYLNKKLPDGKYTLFIGDSITKGFNLKEYFVNPYLVNRGIFFDTTYGLLHRIEDNANNLNTEKVFLMIGYNDLRYRTNEEIVKNIAEITKQIKTESIYVQSLLPTKASQKEINKRIIEINMHLRKFCDRNKYRYVDLYSRFVTEEGGINPKYSRDGVHPNFFGYRLWAEVISPYILAE